MVGYQKKKKKNLVVCDGGNDRPPGDGVSVEAGGDGQPAGHHGVPRVLAEGGGGGAGRGARSAGLICLCSSPDRTFKTCKRNKFSFKHVMKLVMSRSFLFRRLSAKMLHYMFKTEFVTLASLEVPSGSTARIGN